MSTLSYQYYITIIYYDPSGLSSYHMLSSVKILIKMLPPLPQFTPSYCITAIRSSYADLIVVVIMVWYDQIIFEEVLIID